LDGIGYWVIGCTIAIAFALIPTFAKAEPRSRLQSRSDPVGPSLRADTEPVRRLIVKYRDDALARVEHRKPLSGIARAGDLNALGLHTKGSRKALHLAYLKSISAQTHVMLSEAALSRADMRALARTIESDPRVEYAEIDERVYPAAFTPNDPDYATSQWNLKSPTAPDSEIGGANLPDAWGLAVGGQSLNGSGVTVAVLDTGYRAHTELAANLVFPSYDFVSADSANNFGTAHDGDGRDADAQDPGDWGCPSPPPAPLSNSTWHGTRVAGIIGAAGNNGIGTIGAAYGAKILPVRVLGVCGGFTSDIAAGIQWAAGLGVPGVPNNTAHIAKVINLSIGASGSCSATFQDAITAARNAGSVIVAATGNSDSGGATTISSPANCNGVIAVTAHDRNGDSPNYANVGIGTSISAPGGSGVDGIYSTSNSGTTIPIADTYTTGFGTSFAAPHVSAVAALLFQIRPTISPDAVLHYLTANARAFPTGGYCDVHRPNCGAGLLDSYGAATAQGNPNRAPVLATIPAQTAQAGTVLQFTASASDADGDRVSFTATGLPSGAGFDGNAGKFYWGYALPGNYSVQITPGDGLTTGAPQTVLIQVTGALSAGSGGGGGGALGLTELAAGALLLLASWGLRRRRVLSPQAP
jgi:serine protease